MSSNVQMKMCNLEMKKKMQVVVLIELRSWSFPCTTKKLLDIIILRPIIPCDRIVFWILVSHED